MYVCPLTQRSLRGWRSPSGVTFPMWDGIPVLMAEPEVFVANSEKGTAPTDLFTPFASPSMLQLPDAVGSALGSETRTPDGLATAWATQHAPPGPALDAGCGLAGMALRMASRGRSTWAVDRDPHALVMARDILLGRIREVPGPDGHTMQPLPVLPLRPGQVNFAIADLCQPPFAAASFAWIHLGAVPLSAPLLSTVSSLLVKGGLLTIMTAHREDPTRGAGWLEAQVNQQGLAVVATGANIAQVRWEDPWRLTIDLVEGVAARRGR